MRKQRLPLKTETFNRAVSLVKTLYLRLFSSIMNWPAMFNFKTNPQSSNGLQPFKFTQQNRCTPTGLVLNKNMAASSLFRGTNTSTVTS